MSPGAPSTYGGAVRVLICDDEPSIRLLFRLAFEDEGAEVVEAVDGNECIAVAEASAPDLVILDLFMPKRDGLSTLPELKRLHPSTRVLVVSAHAAVDIFEQSRSRGATACFDKLNFVPRIPEVLERYCGAA
jgi:two-component system, NtrC family, nitrogen regulation response regulator NtrX